MYDSILIRYAEIALKGKNQKDFFNRLVKNIKMQIKTDLGFIPQLDATKGRIFLLLNEKPAEIFYDSLDHVFGISSYSPVRRVALDMEEMKRAALSEMIAAKGEKNISFRVTVRRSDKAYPVGSMEMAEIIADHLMDHINGLTVDLKHSDVDLHLEIRSNAAYIHTLKYPGLGGLPLGTGGKAMVLLSGGIDSPVAGWYTMRRGVTVEAIHFHSYPYTSEAAKEKVLTLAEEMAAYSGRMVVHLVPFTKIQEEIAHYCHDNLRITIMRRIMLRIAEQIATNREALAIVTGDNLGQVASQTMESLYTINAVTNMPILRPLITMDKEEITTVAKKIGTYETSILPYEDCCTVFVPKNPKTKPKVAICETEEEKLDLEQLIHDAVEQTEVVVKYGKKIEGRRQTAHI